MNKKDKEDIIRSLGDLHLDTKKQEKSVIDDDPVNSPSHYQTYNTKFNIECIDAMRAAFGDDVVCDFCKCNAFKYIWRHTSKGHNEDIRKALWYLNKYLELGGCE